MSFNLPFDKINYKGGMERVGKEMSCSMTITHRNALLVAE
jgi:hypothetical protein